MLQIMEPESTIASIIGAQSVCDNEKYRLFKFVKTTKVDDGMLILNTLTGELVFLESQELPVLDETSSNFAELKAELVEKWFFVKSDFDDLLFCKQAEKLINRVSAIYTNSPITSFTVLTTTDCNARCFYCYQHGCEHKTMDQKTAEETAKFIIKSSKGNSVNLRWFGGEPLYNSEAIDTIVSKLVASEISFASTMTSNGYLFDKDLIKKAVEDWKLQRVQITLDGTEQVYNRVKAYIYDDETSPFLRVIDNIENLLVSGVAVRVRTNIDKHNSENVKELTDYLIKKFKKYSKFSVYAHLLFDDSCLLVKKHSSEEKESLYKFSKDLNEELRNIFPSELNKPLFLRYRNHCIADIDSAILILPDGNLSKCDHYLDSHYVGNVSTGITDFNQVGFYKRIRTVARKCDSCVYRMLCMSLAICPSTRSDCNEYEFLNYDKNIEKEMLRAFKDFSDKEEAE